MQAASRRGIFHLILLVERGIEQRGNPAAAQIRIKEDSGSDGCKTVALEAASDPTAAQPG